MSMTWAHEFNSLLCVRWEGVPDFIDIIDLMINAKGDNAHTVDVETLLWKDLFSSH